MSEVEAAGATDERQDVNEMSEAELKVYENRLRRMAHRQGLQLQKSLDGVESDALDWSLCTW